MLFTTAEALGLRRLFDCVNIKYTLLPDAAVHSTLDRVQEELIHAVTREIKVCVVPAPVPSTDLTSVGFRLSVLPFLAAEYSPRSWHMYYVRHPRPTHVTCLTSSSQVPDGMPPSASHRLVLQDRPFGLSTMLLGDPVTQCKKEILFD